MHHAFKLGDDVHQVQLSRAPAAYRLHLGERVLDVTLASLAEGRSVLRIGARELPVVIATRGDEVFVHLDGETYALRHQHPLDRLAAAAGGSADDQIRAPMPGSIVSLAVAAGDTVTRGQTLLVMESMKMETTIVAPRDATIARVGYERGQTFDRDTLLVALEPAP